MQNWVATLRIAIIIIVAWTTREQLATKQFSLSPPWIIKRLVLLSMLPPKSSKQEQYVCMRASFLDRGTRAIRIAGLPVRVRQTAGCMHFVQHIVTTYIYLQQLINNVALQVVLLGARPILLPDVHFTNMIYTWMGLGFEMTPYLLLLLLLSTYHHPMLSCFMTFLFLHTCIMSTSTTGKHVFL